MTGPQSLSLGSSQDHLAVLLSLSDQQALLPCATTVLLMEEDRDALCPGLGWAHSGTLACCREDIYSSLTTDLGHGKGGAHATSASGFLPTPVAPPRLSSFSGELCTSDLGLQSPASDT